ncbi:hypothetical protein VN97_g7676 [Penicillium thymicola]|uniref:Uncharacterized protein n=1 Tax=Penicillium thymicola TaxID=293382 RepID=A0AAI9TEB4_PENTH|nr:hypothetical protein VN97_g7676 [Penicillium thymicola]
MGLDDSGTHSYDVDSRCSHLLVLLLGPSPSSVDGASELNVHCLQLAVILLIRLCTSTGPDVAHAGEAASCDMGAKVLYAFYTEGGQTDCFDFDSQTVLISIATCAATVAM